VTTAGGTYTLANIEKGYVFWQAIAPTGGTVDARDWAKPLRYKNWSARRVTFLGGHASDRATGGTRRDILKGFDGDDTLLGKAGRDSLIGGRGRDVCRGPRL
jgi:Ca2+-binding RTX toxin-like protein